MKKMVSSLAVVAFMVGATGAGAQTQTSENTGASPSAPAIVTETTDPDANKQICKSQKVTGTRLSSKKVCKTKAEWDEFTRSQRENANEMLRDPTSGGKMQMELQ
ncbi:hypothetical protein [Niveispirillum irakense]|uniref:hypothetical protein n=1 Tax=Niveispirillum irakense TaxID=34011 RepID=UPI0004095373|nr:hypothetical protein [Niveispirillum irakense]